MAGFTLKEISDAGMGIASFAMLIWMLWKIVPAMNALERKLSTSMAQNQEVIRNNTEALQQQARANDNVANALALIGNSTSTVCQSLEKHDKRAEDMMMDIVKMRETLNHVIKGGMSI